MTSLKKSPGFFTTGLTFDEIVRTPVKCLTQEEYRQCYRLNMGLEGMMRPSLVESRHDPNSKDMTYRILDGDGVLLAWSLVFMPYGILTGWDAHFYVRRTHRRQGLGTRLREAVYRDFPDHHVCPHNLASKRFFNRTHRY